MAGPRIAALTGMGRHGRRPWRAAALLWALAGPAAGAQDRFTLDPELAANAAIVVPPGADAVPQFAAQELQKHLGLVLGTRLPILPERDGRARAFLVGVRPPGDAEPLGLEEARYRIDADAVYLYGDDLIRRRADDLRGNVVGGAACSYNRAGTLFAVYDFLERELGIRWLEPGDEGIAYAPQPRLRLPLGAHRWASPFQYQRALRSYAWDGTDVDPGYIPSAFVLTPEQARARRAELDLWLRRMRMGAKDHLPFGHAFTNWWARYGVDHPEYFALNGRGERAPLFADRPDRVQICPSEPGVVRQAVQDWMARRQEDTLSTGALCVALNDGGGGGAAEFCHCDRCLALDVRRPGEAFDAHLADRYLFLANQALAAARHHVPGALVTAYAYDATLLPPRRERVADGVVVEVVSAMNAPRDQTAAVYDGWRAAGATRLMFRPNDLCVELGLPLGHERRLFDHQQLAVRHGVQGTDHDCVYGLWSGMSGLAYYVLARSHIDPTRSFADWEDEYAAAYGPAAPEVKAYYRYWRERFERVVAPADQAAQRAESGAAPRGFLTWHGLSAMSSRVDHYYRVEDFDRTDRILERAAARSLDPGHRRLVQRLMLANRHNRLTWAAMQAVNRGDDDQILARAGELLAFRLAARDSLQINWWRLFDEQHQMGDACGIALLLKQERLADRRLFPCVPVPAPPVVDGRLDEPLWEQARTGVGFLANQSAEPPRAATEAMLAYDAGNLYLAVRCSEPHLDRAVEKVTQRDGEVWEDNAVEVFLDPGNTRTDFRQLIVSSAGVLLDGRRAAGRFGLDWDLEPGRDLECAVGKGEGAWVVELRVPFSSLGMSRPRPGDTLRFNVTRDRVVTGEPQEATALSPTFGGFHLPQRFTVMVFR